MCCVGGVAFVVAMEFGIGGGVVRRRACLFAPAGGGYLFRCGICCGFFDEFMVCSRLLGQCAAV